MITKQKGDIAEQAVILKALQQGWGVCRPIGDRLPYELIIDIDGLLVKIQVKSAWFDEKRGNYVIDTRRAKTNRRVMIRATYCATDFDYAVAYIEELSLFYIIPVTVFVSYGSEIHLVESEKRQRLPRSAEYRKAWHLLTAKQADMSIFQQAIHSSFLRNFGPICVYSSPQKLGATT